MTDEDRAIPSYEPDELLAWRDDHLVSTKGFRENAVSFERHYTGSLAGVPSRPTMFTGHYPDLHGVSQTDGLGKMADDSRMRWLPEGEVPTLGNWFRAAGYDTHYDGKWHISHADIIEQGKPLSRPTPTRARFSRMRSLRATSPKKTRSRRTASPAGSDPSRTVPTSPTPGTGATR